MIGQLLRRPDVASDDVGNVVLDGGDRPDDSRIVHLHLSTSHLQLHTGVELLMLGSVVELAVGSIVCRDSDHIE